MELESWILERGIKIVRFVLIGSSILSLNYARSVSKSTKVIILCLTREALIGCTEQQIST